jgi:putative hydrolase of HD superfamily
LAIDAASEAEAEIVRLQLNAYNAKDIEAFMQFWSADAEVFAWPSKLIAKGADEIRSRHLERFKEPDLHAQLISRVGVGGLVVDREIVTRNFATGRAKLDVIGIYEFDGGAIRRAWFKQGAPIAAG